MFSAVTNMISLVIVGGMVVAGYNPWLCGLWIWGCSFALFGVFTENDRSEGAYWRKAYFQIAYGKDYEQV